MRKLLWLAVALIAVPATAQQPTYTPDQATLAVTLGSLNAAATVRLEGRGGAGIVITTANLDGTVTPEVSVDCSTWIAARFLSPAGISATSLVFSGGSDAQTHTIIADGGMCGARARVSTYVGGTSVAQIRATYVTGSHFATQPISGTVTATGPLTDTELRATPVPVSGTVTVTDGAGALNVIVDSATLGTVTVAGAKSNDAAAPGATNIGTLPALANAGAPTWSEGNQVALSTNLAGALRVTGGGGGTEYVVDDAAPANPTGATLTMERDDQLAALTEVEGDWTNPRATSKGALWVAIPDASGDPITSFGGGTQYTEGNIDATITGTAMMLEGAADTLVAAPGTVADGLLVNLGANNDVTVSGVATAANQLPDGHNVTVDNAAGAAAVNVQDGGNSITIDAASLPLPTGAATSALQDGIVKDGAGDTTQANVSTGRLHVDGSGVTQPVSGTVTVTDGAGALNVIVDSGTLTAVTTITNPVQLSDGVDTALVSGTGALTVTCDNCGGSTFADDDVFTGGTTPVVNIGALYDTTPPAITDGSAGAPRMNSSRALLVDPSGVTSPVSAASLPLPTGAATSALQLADGHNVTANAGTNLNTSTLLTTTAHDNAFGTAGAADAQVRTVQGVASMTPLLTDGSATTQPISAASLPLPTGAATSALQTQPGVDIGDVTINNAAGASAVNIQDGGNVLTVDGTLSTVTTVTTVTNLTNLPNEGQQTAANSISVTPDTDNDAVGAAGSAPPGEYVAIGGVTSGATGGFLKEVPICSEFFAVNIVTATTTLAITGVSGRHVYVCSINLVTAAANNVTLIMGTGATCGTSTAAMIGGTTAATGWNFAANGGIAQGSGVGVIMATTASGGATGDSVCIVTSAATQLSGVIGYAIY